MTALEASLVQCQWCWTGRAFTTVKEGYGFVIFRHLHQMWLAGLSKETVKKAQECHNDVPPRVTGFWVNWHGSYTERMFEVPATPELVSAVVLSACPELPR